MSAVAATKDVLAVSAVNVPAAGVPVPIAAGAAQSAPSS